MTILAKSIGYPLLAVLYVLIGLLSVLYLIDFVHELITDFKFWMLLIVMFVGSGVMTIIYWGASVAAMPLSLAISDEANTPMRIVGIALTPLGLAGGFLLWQVQNWFFYGVLDIDPWVYNGVFRHLDLAL